jgi:hypothetical protein
MTAIKQTFEGKIQIHPNPTNGLLIISFGTTPIQEAIIEIFNLLGNLVFSETFHNTTYANIDLTGFPNGMYLTMISADRACYGKKVLKE